jgi:hypothetical protein
MASARVKRLTHKVIHKRCELIHYDFQMNDLRVFSANHDEQLRRRGN